MKWNEYTNLYWFDSNILMLKTNLGMYAEEVINRTANYYQEKNICYIEKREVPIKPLKCNENGIVIGKILNKSKIDYFGFIKNKHFEFEVKQTKNHYFDINLLKTHQLEWMKTLFKNNVTSFLIVYSDYYEKFFLIKSEILFLLKNKTNFIELEKQCFSQKITFPGIFDFINQI